MKLLSVTLILIFIAACLITASLIPREPPLKAEVVVLRQDIQRFESRLTKWETDYRNVKGAMDIYTSRKAGRGE
uniref:Uncharacterized protein n=1 Tax=viral metagenome TaxID=1070528 RepID=A0A6M3JUV8_9ZZZZ